MKTKIDQIYVQDIGWLKSTDDIRQRGYADCYQLIKIVADTENSYVFQCFDFDGNLVREINYRYVICVDYKE